MKLLLSQRKHCVTMGIYKLSEDAKNDLILLGAVEKISFFY